MDDYGALKRIFPIAFIGLSTMLSCIVFIFGEVISQRTRLELQVQVSKNELEAATSVLQSVCDVVIEVDNEFCLQEHSALLSDLLMLNPQRRLEGECLTDLLHSDGDQTKFLQQMRLAA